MTRRNQVAVGAVIVGAVWITWRSRAHIAETVPKWRDAFVEAIRNWEYTAGWGALGTVFVASIAVLVNIRSNQRTLKASADQFEKSQEHARSALDTSISHYTDSRESARMDKLRLEVIGLMDALALRRVQLDIALNRIDEEVAQIAESEKDLHYRMQRVNKVTRGIMATEYWGVYSSATAHGFAIQMLSNDRTLTELVVRTLAVVGEERSHFEDAVMNRRLRRRDPEEAAEADRLDDELREFARQITKYALTKLAVSRYT